MRYWSFQKGFGYGNLALQEGDSPRPGPREVLVGMRAASLNFRDLVVLRGQHGRAVQPPLIPLSDGVGEVLAVGEGVRAFSIGDRVSPCFFQNWQGGAPPRDLEIGRLGGPLDGVLATERVFPEDGLVSVPRHLSDTEAATLPCAGLTAWSALFGEAPMRVGETLLILGTGGVALMALQLAKAAGVRTIVTTSSAEKAARVTELGADLVIDRSEVADWAGAARAAGDGGVDRVLELGGAATLPLSIKATRVGGQIILVGNVTGNTAELFLPAVLTRQMTLRSVTVGSKQGLNALNRALAAHEIRPIVGKTVAFEDAPEAFRALEAQGTFGNICIQIDG